MEDLGINIIISIVCGVGGGWVTLKITQAVQGERIKTLKIDLNKLEKKLEAEVTNRNDERDKIHEILDKIKADTAFIKGKLDK